MSIVALKRKSNARNVPKCLRPKRLGACCTMKGAYESDYVSPFTRMNNLVKRETVKPKKDISGDFIAKMIRIDTCENEKIVCGETVCDEETKLVKTSEKGCNTVKVNTNYNRRIDTVQYIPLTKDKKCDDCNCCSD